MLLKGIITQRLVWAKYYSCILITSAITYSETCVRQPPLRLTLVADEEK